MNIESIKMTLSINHFTLDSSKPIEIYLVYNDIIRHNYLTIAPSTLDIVEKKADIIATTADGASRNWVPDTPEVVFYFLLIGIGEKYMLNTALSKKRKYLFVCMHIPNSLENNAWLYDCEMTKYTWG